eukprot:TRINITY_DN7350_c0_g1_i1.p1 TRINITY_DN7350_c0_g1~~TRINITY_DN7350_c0_g1_i1.p1  ORF type:complete len:164 (-),score=37.35 TRINITY_DN7350_c0_g1_i1:63-509(-)
MTGMNSTGLEGCIGQGKCPNQDESSNSSGSENGDIECGIRQRVKYRLASNFELGDDQPPGNVEKRGEQELGSSHNHLFGPPTPAAVKRMRIKKLHEGDPPVVRKSKKPLPVNPLTGSVIGDFNAPTSEPTEIMKIKAKPSKVPTTKLW